MTDKDWPRASLLNLWIDCVTPPRLLAWLRDAIATRADVQVVTLNPEMAYASLNDASLRTILQQAEIVIPDGIGVIWALQHQGVRLERFPGIELVEALLALGEQEGFRFFFLGSSQPTLEALQARLAEHYPRLQIAGLQNGYFSDQDLPAILERIQASHPDILLVALGAPRQEQWIAAHRQTIGVPLKIGVGGSLDVLSGQLQRAPQWVRQVNLEWLYRFTKQPARWRRMLVLPRFVLKVLSQ